MTEKELAKLLDSNPDVSVEGGHVSYRMNENTHKFEPRPLLPLPLGDDESDNHVTKATNKRHLCLPLDNSSKNSSSSTYVYLELPYPPSANRYWRNFKGRMVRSTEATKYKKAVAELCEGLGVQPTSGKVKVDISLYRPAKRGDLDNRVKICLDSLQGFAYIDDKQVVEIHAKLLDDKHNPRVEIVVTEVE